MRKKGGKKERERERERKRVNLYFQNVTKAKAH